MKLDERHTVLDYVIEQLSFSKLIDKKFIATTELEQDNVIEQASKNLGLECFRGSSEDVLNRYYKCAKKFNVDNILRITSDCPLIDPEIVDRVIKKYQTKEFDYVSNTLLRTFPVGTDVEIFSFKLLEKSWENSTLPSEREHVTPYIRNKKLNCRLGNLENDKKLDHLRWTLDRIEDFELIKKITEKISKRPILMNDILDLFSAEPELIKINAHISQNEGIQRSLKKDKQKTNQE